jgi:uncharacterized membrane protein
VNLPYLQLVVLSVCAIFFYRAGQHERSWGVLWALLSIAVSFLAMRFLDWGMIGVFVGQAVLFVGITLYRVWKRP